MKFNIILEPSEEGGFNVSVPALDGCFTQGNTEDEAISNAKEEIYAYL
jgi:predicted RNase H-like HicB family nuclease